MKNLLPVLLLTVSTVSSAQEMTQRAACAKFSDAIVSIDAGGDSIGSGFFVSADGYVLTASHVLRGSDNVFHSAIEITTGKGEHLFAKAVTVQNADNIGKDYALLKVDADAKAKPSYPFLTLGQLSDVTIGADATIIGFPFSAIGANGERIHAKFCLSASFAAISHETHKVAVTQTTKAGPVSATPDVTVDVIYFEGPSVKGISGSPVISRDTGAVLGIVSTKLTGISPQLEMIQGMIGRSQAEMVMGGVPVTRTLGATIDTLDSQLANGLGSAVSVEPAIADLRRSKHK
jgi:S1-C subfamily serine protease